MHLILRWVVIVVCVCGFDVSLALAGDPLARPSSPEALAHLDRGNALYNTRSFAEAISEFKAGAVVDGAPVFDFNLGQSYRQLGNYQAALWHYDRFLKYGQPAGQLLDAVMAFMKEMQGHLANRALTMPPTDVASESDATRARHGSARAPTPPPTATQPRPQPNTVPPDDRADSINWGGWTVTGMGALALGGAGFLFQRVSSLTDQANAEPYDRARDDLHDEANTRHIVGIIVGVGGVVLTATGIYMLVSHGRHHEASSVTAFDVGISGSGIVAFGHF
jgi:tetratricopeptide (TPR) repeat protein